VVNDRLTCKGNKAVLVHWRLRLFVGNIWSASCHTSDSGHRASTGLQIVLFVTAAIRSMQRMEDSRESILMFSISSN
jgi:hypothetical protein